MSFWDLFFILMIYVPLIVVWVSAVVDIFSRHDIGGASKALWLLAVVLVPFFGALIYLIVRPQQAAGLAGGQAPAPGGSSTSAELERLAKLRADGTITEAEYSTLEGRLLA